MLRLIYNATILSYANAHTTMRSGVFFVAKNILDELKRRADVEVALYCDAERYAYLQDFAATAYPGMPCMMDSPTKLRVFLAKKIVLLRKKQEQSQIWSVRKLYGCICHGIVHILHMYHPWTKADERFCQYDAYLSPWHPLPAVLKKKAIPAFFLIHDMMPFLYTAYREMLKKSNPFAQLIRQVNDTFYYFPISEATKKDFLRFCPAVNQAHLLVSYNGISDRFRPVAQAKINSVKQKYAIQDAYAFSLGNVLPHKNLVTQLQAFITFVKKEGIKNFTYVIAGGGSDFPLLLEKYVAPEDKAYIQFIGYVADEDIPPLYAGATWFSFTSEYEGFGLPVLEAMRCGCPVVAGNTSALPEICGDAALCIDCHSVDEHIAAYRTYYFDKKIRAEKIEKGFIQGAKFTWTKSVDEKLAFIKEHCKESAL